MSRLKNDSPDPAGQPSFAGLRPSPPPAFACARCGACCAHQAIQLNPWEVWRLARRLGQATGEFIARHTDNAGLFLRFGPDGRCGFLTPTGCAVHPARPLACRLYPLGLEADSAGQEVFTPLPRHPQCQGGASPALAGAALAAYLAGQGAGPWLAAQRAYVVLARELEAGLAGLEPPARRRAEGELLGDGREPGLWQDLDRVGEPGMNDPAAALSGHAARLRRWLAGWRAGAKRKDAYF
ncbi:MAG: YkgJ family cysteine cluster protein [Desulfarculus sp.]|nr:YkgJ family cysteine cluster protein [Desulfarculus sp.]